MTGEVEHPERLVVTIDGPAGSGKSTTAREVARRLGFRHLDSGALYRALSLAVLREGIPEYEWGDLGPARLEGLDVRLVPAGEGFRVLVDGEAPGDELRSAEVTRAAPRLAKNPSVREKLGELQRSALQFGDLVADGRDMGTVVFPDAALKVFLTASLQERARRRLLQDGREVSGGSVAEQSMEIRDRDESDSRRAVAPLRRPAGALEIDTTAISFETQVERIADAASALTAERGQK